MRVVSIKRGEATIAFSTDELDFLNKAILEARDAVPEESFEIRTTATPDVAAEIQRQLKALVSQTDDE